MVEKWIIGQIIIWQIIISLVIKTLHLSPLIYAIKLINSWIKGNEISRVLTVDWFINSSMVTNQVN